MLFTNNPDAIMATHEYTLRERAAHRRRRNLLRLVDGGDVAERR